MTLKITSGINESEQMDSFQNATLQSAGDSFAVSISTRINIPESIFKDGQVAIDSYLKEVLGRAVKVSAALDFEVQIGKSENFRDDEEDSDVATGERSR